MPGDAGLGHTSLGAFPDAGPSPAPTCCWGSQRVASQGQLPALRKPQPEGQMLAWTGWVGWGEKGAILHPIPTDHSTPKTRVAEGPRRDLLSSASEPGDTSPHLSYRPSSETQELHSTGVQDLTPRLAGLPAWLWAGQQGLEAGAGWALSGTQHEGSGPESLKTQEPQGLCGPVGDS